MKNLDVTGHVNLRAMGHMLQGLQDKLMHVRNTIRINVEKDDVKPEVYFEDGRRKIDYVIVCNKVQYQTSQISNFIKNLIDEGIDIEVDKGKMHTELTFMKLHAPIDVVNHFANMYEIDFHCNYNERYRVKTKFFWKCMTNDSIRKKPEGKLYERISNINEIEDNVTDSERIMVMNKILERIQFSKNTLDYGIHKMQKGNIIDAAYPLHDGDWEWSHEGSLNYRQVLCHYWANFYVWYQYQPLNMIERYFGAEVALHFAFSGFYNHMLIYSSVIGVVYFLCGSFFFYAWDVDHTHEICNSQLPICPICTSDQDCKVRLLKNSCDFAKLSKLFDNFFTVCFAVIMSFWATLFIELWKRKENMLKLRWNLFTVPADKTTRLEYHQGTSSTRISEITGEIEPYIPWKQKLFRYSVTTSVCFGLVMFVLFAILGVVLYRVTLAKLLRQSNNDFIKKHITLIAMGSSAMLTVIFIKIFEIFYGKIALFLTHMENPRTIIEFENSYIYKRYALSFVNNYAPVMYIAFLKGRFFTHPADESHLGILVEIQLDICHPTGCIMSLCIQLFFVLFIKGLFLRFLDFVMAYGTRLLKTPKLRRKKQKQNIRSQMEQFEGLPQWEKDYVLTPSDSHFIALEYMDIVLQYGLVTFFVAAFPLAPLISLLNNLIELRLDAYKLMRNYRRPVPRRLSGLGAWKGILQAITYISTVTNAFVIGFTSDFVPRQIYRLAHNGKLVGYTNKTFSSFKMSDYKKDLLKTSADICYYRGLRNPHDHPNKYLLSDQYWYELSFRFLFVVIFEHIILGLAGIFAYAIPDIPGTVKKQLDYEDTKMKKLKMEMLQETFIKDHNNSKLGEKDFTLQ